MLTLFTLALLNAAPTESFALVVTNNRSLDTRRADLRYADDDGVAYSQLFDQLLGAKHTVLLTQLDRDTRALAPGLAGTPSPTLANLDEAVATLANSIEAAKAAGAASEIFLVFAAHGDVEEGKGYLELLDGRLTAEVLEARVIKPLSAAKRLHLIIDSCNSYFMLNPRKPGGRRWGAEGLPAGLSSRYPNLGTFLSTNAEAESYEWSELQSGIFSYEVRSGLRGAADANFDGSITYNELAAFVERANQDIPNAQYRPRLAWSAPEGAPATPIVELGVGSTRAIEMNGDIARRLTLRDRQGVRLADVHQERGTPLRLVVPDEPGELGVFTYQAGETRPSWSYRRIPPKFRGDIDTLPTDEPPTGARGDSAIFDLLFSQPFGRNAFSEYVAAPRPPEPTPFGVTREDVQRLDQRLQAIAEDDRQERVLNTILVSDGLSMLESVRVTDVNLLIRRLRSYDVSSDEARAKAISVTERDFSSIAAKARNDRLSLGTLGVIASGGLAAAGIGLGVSSAWEKPALPIAFVSTGLLFGILCGVILGNESAIERAWSSWDRNATIAPTEPAVRVSLSPNGLWLSGTF